MRREPATRLTALVVLAAATACGAPAGVRLTVDRDVRSATPSALLLSIYDARGVLADSAQRPILLRSLPAHTGWPAELGVSLPELTAPVPLRVVLSEATPTGGLGGAGVLARPDEIAEAVVTLSTQTPDADRDRVPDSVDNCLAIANADQASATGGVLGDACAKPMDGGT